MKISRMSKLFGMLMLALFATLFQPQLQLTDHGVDIAITSQAFADEPEPEPQPKPQPQPQPEPEPQPKPQPAKKQDNDEPEPEPEPDEPDPEPEPDEATEFVSREEYDELKGTLEGLTKARQEEVVNRRLDHAINEKYIDESDEDAVAEIKKIAADDTAWASYRKLASPKTPDHISAKRFQSKHLKSNTHTGDSKILETVLEHQKA